MWMRQIHVSCRRSGGGGGGLVKSGGNIELLQTLVAYYSVQCRYKSPSRTITVRTLANNIQVAFQIQHHRIHLAFFTWRHPSSSLSSLA